MSTAPETIVIYQFNLADGVSESDFLAVSEKCDEMMQNMNGFMYRSLAKVDEATWLDVVYWQNAEACKQANQEFEAHADGQALLGMVNMSSTQMTQAHQVSQAVGAACGE